MNELDSHQKLKEKARFLLNRAFSYLKKILTSTLTYTLLSGLLTSGLIYWMTKRDNHSTFCMQQTSSFDKNNFKNKDLSILIDKCYDEIKKYGVLEEIVYDSNSTDKFSIFINQLYVHNKINNEFIIDFTDKPLMNNIQNRQYNFNEVYVNQNNNLPKLASQIEKYLAFNKEILYKTYKQEQFVSYFNVFLILFREWDIFEYSFEQPYDTFWLEKNKQSVDTQVSLRFQNLQKILENAGKIDNRTYIFEKEDKFIIALNELFNSYKNRNNKNILIDRLIFLIALIENNEKLDRQQITNENVNDNLLSFRIIQSILYELSNYKLDDSELKKIFHEYTKIIKYRYLPYDTTNKLVQQLFAEKFGVGNSNKDELYRQLFVESYKNKTIAMDSNFITYLAIKKQVDLLMDILKFNSGDRDIKSQIFHALIISQLYHKNSIIPRVDYTDILTEMIKNEEDEELKRFFLRDSLLLNNVEIIELVIDYIKNHESYYLEELNENISSGNNFYWMSIFRYLSDSKSHWILNQQEIKKKKLDLFINIMNKIQNKENKLRLFECAIKTIEKDDIFLIEELKSIIADEKDVVVKEEMLNQFTTMKSKL